MLGGNNSGQTTGGSQSSVLGKVRPKMDPELLAQLKQEQMMNQQQMQDGGLQDNSNAQGRFLPNVSMDPISAALSGAPQSGDSSSDNDNQIVPAAQANTKPSEANPFEGAGDSSPSEPATYGAYNGYQGGGSVPAPPPGAVAGGLVPPPPAAVSLSTQANISYADPNANPYMNPYANPALNQWGIPQMPFQQAAPQAEQQRPSGLFGSGSGSSKKSSSSDSDDEEKEKKDNFVPIQPTGMQSRSQYKQRDDLKVLWNGALATQQYQNLIDSDGDLENRLKQVNVGLPPDSTKGIFSVTPRVVNSVFKPQDLGKKSTDKVQKLQQELVQSYYRYLYEYNKYSLAQQTVSARKQEVDVANSKAEKQRAAADLANAQNEADSAKEDMSTAQYELAANAGARAASSIIGKVSGVTPPVASLASAEKSAQPEAKKKGGGMFSAIGLGGIFGGGHKDNASEDNSDDDESPAPRAKEMIVKEIKEKPTKVAKADKSEKSEKSSKKKSKSDDEDDLAPSSAPEKPKVTAKATTPAPTPAAQTSRSPISFDLKDIDITARKSILTVSVRNSGSDDFKISPDDISLAEGNKRISDASLRSEFDSLTVKPNEEVKGKITILGKPWNDRLTINMSDGSTTVSLKRR